MSGRWFQVALTEMSSTICWTKYHYIAELASKSLIASANTKGFYDVQLEHLPSTLIPLHITAITQLSDWYFISISILVVFFQAQWTSLHCPFSRCCQQDHWKIFWTWITQRLPNLSAFPFFFCLLHKKAQCHDVCFSLIKTHCLWIELEVSWMLLSASFLEEHLLGFPGHMVF